MGGGGGRGSASAGSLLSPRTFRRSRSFWSCSASPCFVRTACVQASAPPRPRLEPLAASPPSSSPHAARPRCTARRPADQRRPPRPAHLSSRHGRCPRASTARPPQCTSTASPSCAQRSTRTQSSPTRCGPSSPTCAVEEFRRAVVQGRDTLRWSTSAVRQARRAGAARGAASLARRPPPRAGSRAPRRRPSGMRSVERRSGQERRQAGTGEGRRGGGTSCSARSRPRRARRTGMGVPRALSSLDKGRETRRIRADGGGTRRRVRRGVRAGRPCLGVKVRLLLASVMLRATTRRDMTDAGALRPQRALDRMPRRVVLRRRTSAPLCTCTPTLLVRHQPASLPRRPSPSLRRPSFRTRPSARSTSTSPSPPTSTRPASLTFRAISISLSASSPPKTLVSVPMRRVRRRRAGSSSRAVRSTVTRPTAATTSSSQRSSPSPSSSSLSSFSVSFSGRSSA